MRFDRTLHRAVCGRRCRGIRIRIDCRRRYRLSHGGRAALVSGGEHSTGAVVSSFRTAVRAADYAAAVALLDRASHNPIFFPVYRIIVFQLYIRAYLALDDTAQAAKYVDILRHAGGTGWKYRTAFFVIVVNLDWEDIAAAQEEYDAFRKDCAHAQIYREQIGILDAVFAHLAGETPPVPDAAKRSPYPVVHRVIQKYC